MSNNDYNPTDSQNQSPNGLDNRDLALRLAVELGWSVFPCKPDKKPYTKHGKDDATTDPGQIRAWWQRWPAALIGVYCEKSGIFALDIDVKNGIDGYRSWAELVETYGAGRNVEAGPIQKTPSGGLHIIFKLPAGLEIPNNAGKLAEGLDLRSNGYVCTGGAYAWLPGHEPGSLLTDAPAWLLELIRKLKPQKAESQSLPITPIITYQNGADPGAYWLGYYLQRVTVGNRNDTGFYLACQLRDSGLSEGQAESILASYAARVPGDGYSEREALASLESAYRGPRREAAHLPGLAMSTNGNGNYAIYEDPRAVEDLDGLPPMPEIPTEFDNLIPPP